MKALEAQLATNAAFLVTFEQVCCRIYVQRHALLLAALPDITPLQETSAQNNLLKVRQPTDTVCSQMVVLSAATVHISVYDTAWRALPGAAIRTVSVCQPC